MRLGSSQLRNTGFTLVEMIVTIVIGAVLFALGSTILSSGFQTYFLGREITRDDAQGRLALERMTRELRTVRTPTAADLTIGASQITFTDFSGVRIIYRQTGTTLERSQDGGTSYQPLADNMKASTLSFTYLQNDGTTGAGTSDVVYYITVQVKVSSTNVTSSTYQSTVKPTSF